MTTTTHFYLGIDAGGTKTHALIADHQGQVLGFGKSGTGNWESVGLDGAYHAFATALHEALAGAGISAGRLSAAGYALAGLDWPSDQARLAAVVEQLQVPGPYTLVNDTIAALRAGSRNTCGIVVIAGTGSTIAGRNSRGQESRTFGLGRIWGDFNGASELAHRALGAIGQEYHGRGPATILTTLMLDAYQAGSVPELAERMSRGQTEYPNGSLAPLVFAAAAQGDQVAHQIIYEAGADMGQSAAAIARKLELADEAFELVMAGGIFRSQSPILLEALLEPVLAYAPGANPVVLEAPPVSGSVLLAMDAAGLAPDQAVRARLAAETQGLAI